MRDLLSETGRDPEGNSKNLEVRLSVNAAGVKSWYVPDAVARPVADTRDVVATMHEGESNRAMGQTSMNERSSRSHSVVSIQVRPVRLLARFNRRSVDGLVKRLIVRRLLKGAKGCCCVGARAYRVSKTPERS